MCSRHDAVQLEPPEGGSAAEPRLGGFCQLVRVVRRTGALDSACQKFSYGELRRGPLLLSRPSAQSRLDVRRLLYILRNRTNEAFPMVVAWRRAQT